MKKIQKIFIFFIIFFLLFSNLAFAKTLKDCTNIPSAEYNEMLLKNNVKNNFKNQEINQKYIFLNYSEEFDKVLISQNENTKINPASVTKVLTSILAIENLDINEKIKIINKDTVLPQNYVSVPLIVGETVSIDQLLHYTMIPSCNDAAKTLERILNEKTEGFLPLTKKLLNKLDMKDTNITNSYGLADKNHYTTANDLLKLTKYCLKNPIFKDLVNNSYINIPSYGGRAFQKRQNTNLYLIDSNFKRKDILGVKTGYNELSGYFLVSYKNDELSKSKNNKIITIVGNLPSENLRYSVSNSLYSNSSFLINLKRVDEKRKKLEKEEKERLEKERIVKEKQLKKEKIIKLLKIFIFTILFLIFIKIIFKPYKNSNMKKHKK